MTIPARKSANSGAFLFSPVLRWILAGAVIAAVAAPEVAGAARYRAVRPYAEPYARPYAGAYDGIWNVVFATTWGDCGSGYSVPFTVAGGRVFSAGGGRVSGRVSPAGTVAVSVSVGATRASGGGRLAGYGGGGTWRGIIRGSRCAGTWQATRGG